jgi:hypothetical protein
MLLWCLFSGRVQAWEDNNGHLPNAAVLIDNVREGKRPDMNALRSDTPPGVKSLICAAWAPKPEDRPNAVQAVKALARFLPANANVPTPSAAPPPSAPAGSIPLSGAGIFPPSRRVTQPPPANANHAVGLAAPATAAVSVAPDSDDPSHVVASHGMV